MKVSGFDYTVLVVEDLDRALAFYVGLLGLDLNHRSGPYAQLRTGATRLALYERQALARTLDRPLQAPDPRAPAFELAFFVPNVDNAWAELLVSGAEGVSAPAQRPWGQRAAILRDPDGNLVELVEPNA